MRRVREREHRVPHVTFLSIRTKYATAPREPASLTEPRALTATLSPLMIIFTTSTYRLNAFLLTTMFTHAVPWQTRRSTHYSSQFELRTTKLSKAKQQ
ncbi:unnamed protein product [Parnassius apollo]|uniref:(apollo) hypothetical protein n=1 Tax=Parnassius apollo TaxID=110799 RepID=A0A8S3Y590_PARAO|nr:unnamed protein product [Parnassius apollo]